tara:strand:+ start:4527 stop:5477 length:951 start_codon:yes stop_codon:yes gene_type:complete
MTNSYKSHINYLLICLFISSTWICLGQQLPLHNQYVYNPTIINPAFAGVSAVSHINLTTRSQWVGFSEGIKTTSLSGNHAFNENHGIGGVLFQDNTGAISITGLELDYSFKFPVFLDYNMSLGLGLFPYQYFYDASEVEFNDPNDNTLDLSDKATSFDVNFGLFLYNDLVFAGVSVLNMIQSSNIESLEGSEDPNQLVRHYYGIIGYNYFNDASDMGIEQSVLLRSTSSSGLQFDFNLKANFNESFFLLSGYRTNQELLAGFGVKYGKFAFMYNIDINLGSIGEVSNSSHELGLIFYLNNKTNVLDWGNDLNLQYD